MSAKSKKLAVRILAWVLAILMGVGLAVLTVQMIIVNIEEKKAAEEKAQKEQQEQQEQAEDYGHDHEHDHDHDH